jgi:hypothetical protein
MALVRVASLDIDARGVRIVGRLTRLRDLNHDGLADLVVEFELADAGLGRGKVEACVQGELRDGHRLFGCDDVFVRSR